MARGPGMAPAPTSRKADLRRTERRQTPHPKPFLPDRGPSCISVCGVVAVERLVAELRGVVIQGLRPPDTSKRMLAARTAVLARPASSRQPTCSSRRFPAFQPARVVRPSGVPLPRALLPSPSRPNSDRTLLWGWYVQAPSAARKQQVVVCAAAAVEEAVVKAESSAPKMGVAHLRYGKGSVFKVRAARYANQE